MNAFFYLMIYDTTCIVCGTVLVLCGHWKIGIAVLALSQLTSITRRKMS